jgi:transposase
MVCIKPLMHIMDKPVVRTPRRRREHSAEFKEELVARSLEPGVSVAAIAMEGGINANLLFGWRRKHQNAIAQGAAPARPAAVLLPVSIETAPAERPYAASTPPVRSGGGTIEIEIGSARVRLRGGVDEPSLRMVLTALRSLA